MDARIPEIGSPIKIAIATRATPALRKAANKLIPELSANAGAMTVAQFNAIVRSPATKLFVARRDGEVVGMLTLVIVRIPTGLRTHVEDVVVANAHRQQGIGECLARAVIAHAKKIGARTIDLTSRPDREAAVRLYQRMGFEARETGVYRYSFDAAA